jgi:hypothetical protein
LKSEYAGTTAQASAAYRLQIMDDYRAEVVFPPAPPKPAEPPAAMIQLQPGEANAPMIGPALPPQAVPVPSATPTPAPEGEAVKPAAPAPETAAPAAPPETADTNTPKDS